MGNFDQGIAAWADLFLPALNVEQIFSSGYNSSNPPRR